MLRNDYDHNIVSWVGLPLGVLSGVLVAEVAILPSYISVGKFTDMFSIVLTAFFTLAMMAMGSMMFDKMRTRHGQVAYLTLPATSMEKYLVNWIETVVVTFVSFVVGLVAADTLRMALCSAIGYKPEYCTLLLPQVFFKHVLPANDLVLWLQSMMMIGSALWRRKPMVKGLALTVAVALPGSYAIDVIQMDQSIVRPILYVLTAVNYVISYRIFVKSQIR